MTEMDADEAMARVLWAELNAAPTRHSRSSKEQPKPKPAARPTAKAEPSKRSAAAIKREAERAKEREAKREAEAKARQAKAAAARVYREAQRRARDSAAAEPGTSSEGGGNGSDDDDGERGGVGGGRAAPGIPLEPTSPVLSQQERNSALFSGAHNNGAAGGGGGGVGGGAGGSGSGGGGGAHTTTSASSGHHKHTSGGGGFGPPRCGVSAAPGMEADDDVAGSGGEHIAGADPEEVAPSKGVVDRRRAASGSLICRELQGLLGGLAETPSGDSHRLVRDRSMKSPPPTPAPPRAALAAPAASAAAGPDPAAPAAPGPSPVATASPLPTPPQRPKTRGPRASLGAPADAAAELPGSPRSPRSPTSRRPRGHASGGPVRAPSSGLPLALLASLPSLLLPAAGAAAAAAALGGVGSPRLGSDDGDTPMSCGGGVRPVRTLSVVVGPDGCSVPAATFDATLTSTLQRVPSAMVCVSGGSVRARRGGGPGSRGGRGSTRRGAAAPPVPRSPIDLSSGDEAGGGSAASDSGSAGGRFGSDEDEQMVEEGGCREGPCARAAAAAGPARGGDKAAARAAAGEPASSGGGDDGESDHHAVPPAAFARSPSRASELRATAAGSSGRRGGAGAGGLGSPGGARGSGGGSGSSPTTSAHCGMASPTAHCGMASPTVRFASAAFPPSPAGGSSARGSGGGGAPYDHAHSAPLPPYPHLPSTADASSLPGDVSGCAGAATATSMDVDAGDGSGVAAACGTVYLGEEALDEARILSDLALRPEPGRLASLNARALARCAAIARSLSSVVRFAARIPSTPMVSFGPAGGVWHQARVVAEAGCGASAMEAAVYAAADGADDACVRAAAAAAAPGRVLVDCPGLVVGDGGPFWLARDSERLWRGSYKDKDWKYMRDGGWAPKPGCRNRALTLADPSAYGWASLGGESGDDVDDLLAGLDRAREECAGGGAPCAAAPPPRESAVAVDALTRAAASLVGPGAGALCAAACARARALDESRGSVHVLASVAALELDARRGTVATTGSGAGAWCPAGPAGEVLHRRKSRPCRARIDGVPPLPEPAAGAARKRAASAAALVALGPAAGDRVCGVSDDGGGSERCVGEPEAVLACDEGVGAGGAHASRPRRGGRKADGASGGGGGEGRPVRATKARRTRYDDESGAAHAGGAPASSTHFHNHTGGAFPGGVQHAGAGLGGVLAGGHGGGGFGGAFAAAPLGSLGSLAAMSAAGLSVTQDGQMRWGQQQPQQLQQQQHYQLPQQHYQQQQQQPQQQQHYLLQQEAAVARFAGFAGARLGALGGPGAHHQHTLGPLSLLPQQHSQHQQQQLPPPLPYPLHQQLQQLQQLQQPQRTRHELLLDAVADAQGDAHSAGMRAVSWRAKVEVELGLRALLQQLTASTGCSGDAAVLGSGVGGGVSSTAPPATSEGPPLPLGAAAAVAAATLPSPPGAPGPPLLLSAGVVPQGLLAALPSITAVRAQRCAFERDQAAHAHAPAAAMCAPHVGGGAGVFAPGGLISTGLSAGLLGGGSGGRCAGWDLSSMLAGAGVGRMGQQQQQQRLPTLTMAMMEASQRHAPGHCQLMGAPASAGASSAAHHRDHDNAPSLFL
ncbi:hypothetical protein FOA52_011595 [Chlamydomonas sp. UWO 241]|nr:hypothetical protein FOA52_011595 [Chlamydomonas sp. UWO 241]